MTTADLLDQGRESFGRQAWADAYAQLSAADGENPLAPDDLELLGMAAYLIGQAEDSANLLERLHSELLGRGDIPRAVRSAFWLALDLMDRGEFARGSGWLARARRLLDDGTHDCAEQGYLLLPGALQSIDEGDHAAAHAISGTAAAIGDRFDDRDLVTLARSIQGRALLRQGKTVEGMTLLDEVMVAVTAGEVSPIVAGNVYCSVIEGCQESFDLRRAAEWTAALTHWCESQPDLVLYRGQCLVHRAEIMQLHGAWADAVDAAQRAFERFGQGHDQPAVGAAFYQQAELHRLYGQFAAAEDAYREASRRGREPHPGLAQLRLAQGQVDAAAAAIRRVLAEADDHVARSGLLAAHVEIMLAADEIVVARSAADELLTIAGDLDSPWLRAVAAHATGAVLAAEGDGRAAGHASRRAWAGWQQLDVPYEAARARVLIGLACRQSGDEGGAQLQFDAAAAVFQQLGAAPDVARVAALSRPAAPPSAAPPAAGLTGREVQVLRLVAAGNTNRAIAAELVLSEKTVARHVSNIFAKLGLSSRSAATAYAYNHGLV